MASPNPPLPTHPTTNPIHPNAYSYPQPPPQYYPYTPPYNPHLATFIRRLFTIIIAVFIITFIIIFLIFLILRPHLPQITVDNFTLTSPFNLTSTTLTTSFDLKFRIKNPNKKITLSYEHVQAAVFFKRVSLSDTNLPPFVQGRGEESVVYASFASAGTYVEAGVVGEIEEEKGRRNGSVGFGVVLVAEVRLKAGAWRARRRFLKASCGDLVISVLGNGSRKDSGLIGGPRECRVGL